MSGPEDNPADDEKPTKEAYEKIMSEDPTPIMSHIGKHLTAAERDVLRAPFVGKSKNPADGAPTDGSKSSPADGSSGAPTDAMEWILIAHDPLFQVRLHSNGDYSVQSTPGTGTIHRLWVGPRLLGKSDQLIEIFHVWFKQHIQEATLLMEKTAWALNVFAVEARAVKAKQGNAP